MKEKLSIAAVLLITLCLVSCASTPAYETEGYGFYIHEPYSGDIRVMTSEVYAGSQNEVAVSYYRDGTKAMIAGDLVNAEALLRKAIETDSGYIDAYDSLGLLLIMADRNSEAIEPLKKSISLDKTNPIPYGNLCYAYEKMDDALNAITICSDAMTNCNPNAELYYAGGLLLYKYGTIEDALNFFSIALDLYNKGGSTPNVFDTAAYAGICYFKLNEWNLAEKCLNVALMYYKDNETLESYYQMAKKNR